MIKAKFRDHVRSKTDVAMKNEVLAKILCHNICCLIGSNVRIGNRPHIRTGRLRDYLRPQPPTGGFFMRPRGKWIPRRHVVKQKPPEKREEPMSKCPKCEKALIYVNLNGIDIHVGGKSRWHGSTYSCPACLSILSVSIDPISLKSDIIDGVASELKKLLRH